MTMTPLRLQTLGELRLTGPDGELLAGRRKELVLLACLALRAPRAVRREELIGLLWDERPEVRARQSLRQALVRLRRALGDGLIVARHTVQLPEALVEPDVRAFEAAIREGRPRAAVACWGGEFLAGTEDAGGEEYRAWLERVRTDLRGRLGDAFEELVSHAAARGDWGEAVAWSEQWATTFPHDEGAHTTWIESLVRAGRAREAISRWEEFAARLRRDLGLEPSEAIRHLAGTLVSADRAGARGVLSPGSAALFTPDLVARDGALAELDAAWRAVEAGGRATVLIEGEDGFGRTLLCNRFLQSFGARPGPALVLRAQAREEKQDLHLESARELLAPLPSAPGLGGASDRALAEISRLVPAVRNRFPDLPAASGEDRGLPAAVAEVLSMVAEEAPLVIFLDDLHWADRASRELILTLARSPLNGVLLLVTARPQWVAPSAGLAELCRCAGVRRLKLRALDAAEMEQLLQSMIALPADECRTFAARLHAESGGNAFHAVEIVAAMVDEGQLGPDRRGIWHLSTTPEGQALPMPTSVRDAIGRRLARLSADAQRVAAIAARSGGPWVRDALAGVAGLAPDRFDAALDELIARHLLQPDRTRPHVAGELDFAHPMIRRLAHDRFGEGRRAPLRMRRWPRARGLALVAGSIAAVAVIAVLSLRSVRATRLPIIAVGAILQRGAPDTLGTAASISDMLATNLARVSGLQIISNARMYELMAFPGAGDETAARWAVAARRAGAVQLLEGAVHRTGDGLRLDLRRVDLRTGTVRTGYTLLGADAFQLVDRATAEIAAGFGLSPGPLRIAEVSTASSVAYRFYEEGLRSYAVGDYRTAARMFDAAVAEDSMFAMATHYAWLTRLPLHQVVPRRARERILQLADRASDRERLLIRGSWATGADPFASLALAETLATRYPTEPDGHYLRGRARVLSGDFLGALPHLRRVVDMDSLGLRGTLARCRACESLNEIVLAYLLADSIAAADRTAREWVRLQPHSAMAWSALASVLETQDRFDEMISARRRAASINPGHDPYDPFYPALSRIRSGDHESAGDRLQELARDSSNLQRDALWFLTINARNRGRLRDALIAVDRAVRIQDKPGTDPVQHRAQILFELGRFREAAALFDSAARVLSTPDFPAAAVARHRAWNLTHRATALAAAGDTAVLAALADTIEGWGRQSIYGRDWTLHHHVRGLLLQAQGRHEAAAEAFQRAIYSPTRGYTRTNLELARTLLQLNRPHDAVAILQSALRGGLEASNLYVTRTELHELLGRAWDAAGQPDSAALQYDRVLDAWSSADAAFAMRYDSLRARRETPGRVSRPAAR